MPHRAGLVDKKRTIVGDGFNFWVKIKARVNLDEIKEMADRVKEKTVAEDFKKLAAYNNRGLTYDILGNRAKAITDFRKACEMGVKKACKELH